jgi:hypothetical protein
MTTSNIGLLFLFRHHLVCGRAAEADTLPQAVLLPVSQVQVGRHHHFGRQGNTLGFSVVETDPHAFWSVGGPKGPTKVQKIQVLKC